MIHKDEASSDHVTQEQNEQHDNAMNQYVIRTQLPTTKEREKINFIINTH